MFWRYLVHTTVAPCKCIKSTQWGWDTEYCPIPPRLRYCSFATTQTVTRGQEGGTAINTYMLYSSNITPNQEKVSNYFYMWFAKQLAFTPRVPSHSLRSTAVRLAGLQSSQRSWALPVALPAFVLKLWFGPRCLGPHSSPLRGQTLLLGWPGSGRRRDCVRGQLCSSSGS